jgi:putative transcriptional regulator
MEADMNGLEVGPTLWEKLFGECKPYKTGMNMSMWFRFISFQLVLMAVISTVFFLLNPVPSSGFVFKLSEIPPEIKTGTFLVAEKDLMDPNFRESVVLLIQHNGEGTMGLIINRPTKIHISEALPEIKALRETKERIFIGGPVGINQLFTLIQSEKLQDEKDVVRVLEGVYFNASLDILENALAESGPGLTFRGYVGHAGWLPGQLEMELARGSWRIKQGDAFTIFQKDSEQIWRDLSEEKEKLWTLLPPGGFQFGPTS